MQKLPKAPNSQDGVTPLNVVGETQHMLSRDNLDLHLDALVVKDLDVDVLAGTPFMTTNDIAVRPAKNQIRIDEIVIHYGAENVNRPQYHKIRRAQTYVLRAPPVSTTVWPGEYIQLSIPSALNDLVVAVEPRYDQKSTEHYQEWPQPAIIEAVGDKIRLLNTCTHPLKIGRNEHLCQVRGTTAYDINYREDIVVKNTSTHLSPHRIATLASCAPPQTVLGLRSFVGAYKVLGRVIPQCSRVLAPLESYIAGMTSQETLTWSEDIREAFHVAQSALSTNRSITLPRPSDQLWIVTNGSVTKRGIGSTLYVSRNGQTRLSGFFSAKLKKHQVTWLPCEIEALGIATAVKHFSPYIIQPKSKPCLLTDSKPCVQAIDKLGRGEFSSSPRLTSFLSVVARYQVTVRHLAGASNVPSDFASRNAPECHEPHCQICSFISQMEQSVVMSVAVEDIISGSIHLPFTSRSAWLSTQSECPDLRRVKAHLKQGTRPSKKVTNANDVKRYLSTTTLARDGVIVVKCDIPFAPTKELIVVPRQVLDGLLTAIHLKLSHPSKHQLKLVVRRNFFALNIDHAIERVTDACHTCTSLKSIPTTLIEQTTTDAPEAIGVSFAADVIKRNRQLIFVVRETVSSYIVYVHRRERTP